MSVVFDNIPELDIRQDWRWLLYPENFVYYVKSVWRAFISFFVRGWRGYADIDTWEYFTYITKVNIGALKQLKRDKNGSPCGLCDFDNNGMPLCAFERKGCTCCHDRWYVILDKMISGFEAILEEEEDYAEDGFDVYKMRCEERKKRIEEGLKLFAEYYEALWD